jgi:hypothetical protein
MATVPAGLETTEAIAFGYGQWCPAVLVALRLIFSNGDERQFLN